MRLIIYGLMLIILAACGKSEQAKVATSGATGNEIPAPTSADFPPPDAPSTVEREHFYEGKEGYAYFYSEGISDDDRKSGKVANKMIEIFYIGSKDKEYQAFLKNGQSINILSCKEPCEFFTETIYHDGRVAQRERYKNVAGSVAWGIFSDATRGQLDPLELQLNGKMQKVWFSTEKGDFVPTDDSAVLK